jgi:hypothetical protein
MSNYYSLTVVNNEGDVMHHYLGHETARTMGIFIQVADERGDIESVTVQMNDGTIAVFSPEDK